MPMKHRNERVVDQTLQPQKVRETIFLHSVSKLRFSSFYPNCFTHCIHLLEIKRRIALGWAALGNVANIMKSRKASMKIKSKVHNEYVLPVMVYDSATWALNKAHMVLLSVGQRKIERVMLGITRRDHKRNIWIRHQTAVNYIIDVTKKGILGWAGHIARFKDNRTKTVTEWTPREWTRRQGRPKTRWRDNLICHLGPAWPRIARDRRLWKQFREGFRLKEWKKPWW